MKLSPKKSLGQHFLNSRSVLKQIIEASDLKTGESVLEIGPGTGILTRELLNSGAKVCAVEKDSRAYEILCVEFQDAIREGQLKLICADILELDILACDFLKEIERYALVANIPYYITGAILEKFLEHEPRPDRMVLLVQKEVADRILAKESKESILSVSVKAFGTPVLVAKVPKGAFNPPPAVDSAILAVGGISDNLFDKNGVSISSFFNVIHAGFAHKRKFVARNLESVIPGEKINEIWSKLGLNPKIRAEEMSIDQWFGICRDAK